MGFTGLNKLSLLDYPSKISCILFYNKCNFRCPFCHNGLTLLDDDNELSDDEVFTFLKDRIGRLDGVVLTGGEITLMPNLKEVCQKIKKMDFLIKIDTNGTSPKVIKELLDNNLVDYIAMDIKNSLDEYHLIVGKDKVDTKLLIESINIIRNSKIEYEFRTTLINEYHKDNNIIQIGQLLKGSKALYLQKYICSDGVFNKSLTAVNRDKAIEYQNILKKYIDKVELRGY